MQIEMRKTEHANRWDATWTLYVNGKAYVIDETFTVCDQVRESLLGIGGYGECAEVAESIRAALLPREEVRS